MLIRLWNLLRHLWLDGASARRVLKPAAVKRLEQHVTAGEQRHTGQVRVCAEASLPLPALWRHVWHGQSMATLVRARALALFGELGVWDTEHTNGVWIYLLLAQHSIELVADRGLNRFLAPAQWEAMLVSLAADLQAQRFEQGLMHAMDEVTAHLERHFPMGADQRSNELPDAVVLL